MSDQPGGGPNRWERAQEARANATDPVVHALWQRRVTQGLRLLDVGKRLGLKNGNHLGLIEQGKVNPPISRIYTWAAALGAAVVVVDREVAAQLGRPHIRVDPTINAGRPAVDGVDVAAVGQAVRDGTPVARVAAKFGLTRGAVLAACWYLGLHAKSARWRNLWEPWAIRAGERLADGGAFDQLPDPPAEDT